MSGNVFQGGYNNPSLGDLNPVASALSGRTNYKKLAELQNRDHAHKMARQAHQQEFEKNQAFLDRLHTSTENAADRTHAITIQGLTARDNSAQRRHEFKTTTVNNAAAVELENARNANSAAQREHEANQTSVLHNNRVAALGHISDLSNRPIQSGTTPIKSVGIGASGEINATFGDIHSPEPENNPAQSGSSPSAPVPAASAPSKPSMTPSQKGAQTRRQNQGLKWAGEY